MGYWEDVIWIGNILLPRWFVFGAAFAIIAIIIALISVTIWLLV